MIIKGLVDEDFINYKTPCMYICTARCSFKCDKELGGKYCQNSPVAKQTDMDIDEEDIIRRYIQNPITHAVCFSGLEPFDQFDDMRSFIKKLREEHGCNDTVVIYSGYDKDEIADMISALKQFDNIIVKYGRYRPNEEKHYDKVLGVYLASNNQFAERIN